MKILYIIPALQHPTIRGANRHYHFIRDLSARHEITLLSLIRSKTTPEALKEFESYTEKLLSFNVNGEFNSRFVATMAKLPVLGEFVEKNLKLRGGVQRMKQAFRDLVEKERFDLVFFHGKSVFPVIDGWHALPIVTDFCDATSLRIRTSMRYSSWLKLPWHFLKLLQMKQIEKKLVQISPHVAFISNRDRAAILGPADRSEILPLGVDHDYWQRSSARPDENCLIFTGVMDYAPNHDAALYMVEKILPLLKARIANLQILIVGRDPKPGLLEKAKIHPEVIVTGFVEDMRPYMEQAMLFVAPIRYASGTQNKILEAMAMELPVVTTSVVADGLVIDEYGQPPLCKANGEHEFAEHVITLLKNREVSARLAAEGRQFVKRHFDWTASSDKLEKMCLKAISQNGNHS